MKMTINAALNVNRAAEPTVVARNKAVLDELPFGNREETVVF